MGDGVNRMKFEREGLAEFFALGRDRGWDAATQRWTVNQLMDVKGKVPAIGELIAGFKPQMPVSWSGDRYGAPRLRKHIAASQGYAVGADNVLVTLGCQNANFLAALALVSPGDAVLLEVPTWMHMHAVCAGLGASVRTIRRREELGWRFDADELEASLTPDVRLFYFCQPNNPTGATFNSAELEDTLHAAAQTGTYVVVDEIYRGLEWEGETAPAAADLYERAVSTSSVSKTIGLDGLRIGWLVTQDRNLLDTCCRIKQYTSTPHISGMDELLCTAALEPSRFAALLAASRADGWRNLQIVSAWIAEESHFDWVVPRAGFMGFPRYTMPVDSWSFCRRLLDPPYSTYIIPGAPYHMEGYLRIAFGASISPQALRDGLGMISMLASDLAHERLP
jgi:aspartate/methionine/tyrosine aminotransferase